VEGTASGHWVLGVQWHPERNSATNGISRRIFEKLVEEAVTFHKKLRIHAPDFENVPRENLSHEDAPRVGGEKER
jgi:hypothetical protein